MARIISQAGVSRATFYECFGDKDECVLAAYREAVAPVERALAEIEVRSMDPGTVRDVLGGLLADAERDPAVARFLLVEALGAGPAVRAEHERLLDRIEEVIDAALVESSEIALQIPPRGLSGAVAGIISIRAFRGEAGQLRLLDDLLAWIDSHRNPGPHGHLTQQGWEELGAALSGAEPESLGDEILDGRLPRGLGAVSPSLVADKQRERVLAAVARLSREKGYTAMTVANIVATASVTREAFYELFRDKEEAFLATQAFGLEQSVSLTAGRFFGEDEWRDRVWNGLEGMLSYVAGQRDLVFIDLVESYAAGPAAVRRSFENRMAYTIFLEDGYRQRSEAEHLPRICSEAIGGAIHELMRRQVIRGRTEQMLEMLPQMTYLTLAPFLGPTAALALVEAKVSASIS